MTSRDTGKSISSPESEAGRSPSTSPDGHAIDLFGQVAAPASPSRSRAKAKALRTNAIFGPSGFVSSETDGLQRSLENKLRARLDTNGSPEFMLKWSRKLIRSGRRICRLRASRRNIPDNEFSLWRTPAARDWRDLSRTGQAYASSMARHQPSTVTLSYERGFVSSQIPQLLCGLMGFPDQWDRCAPTAMQLSRKSRRNS